VARRPVLRLGVSTIIAFARVASALHLSRPFFTDLLALHRGKQVWLPVARQALLAQIRSLLQLLCLCGGPRWEAQSGAPSRPWHGSSTADPATSFRIWTWTRMTMAVHRLTTSEY
jgi:hypothetical protein